MATLILLWCLVLVLRMLVTSILVHSVWQVDWPFICCNVGEYRTPSPLVTYNCPIYLSCVRPQRSPDCYQCTVCSDTRTSQFYRGRSFQLVHTANLHCWEKLTHEKKVFQLLDLRSKLYRFPRISSQQWTFCLVLQLIHYGRLSHYLLQRHLGASHHLWAIDGARPV